MRKKKNTVRILLLIVFLCVFFFSTTILVVEQIQKRKNEKSLTDAASKAGIESLESLTQPVTKPVETVPLTTVEPTAATTEAQKDTEAETPAETAEESTEESTEESSEETVPETVPYVLFEEYEPFDPDDEIAAVLRNTDLEELRKTNREVKGWIVIPDTPVSYPIMQTDNNQYYLDHLWTGEFSTIGSIYLETTMDPTMSLFNTIVFGHRRADNSMFGILKYYADQNYFEEHRYVYVVTDQHVLRYEVYAVFDSGLSDLPFYIRVGKTATKEAFINFALENSYIDSGIVPGIQDRFLTLTTCMYMDSDARLIVQAVLDRAEPRILQ